MRPAATMGVRFTGDDTSLSRSLIVFPTARRTLRVSPLTPSLGLLMTYTHSSRADLRSSANAFSCLPPAFDRPLVLPPLTRLEHTSEALPASDTLRPIPSTERGGEGKHIRKHALQALIAPSFQSVQFRVLDNEVFLQIAQQ
jgi:hypothetical protein